MLTITGTGFTAQDLTVANTATTGAAPAVHPKADHALFEDVALQAHTRTVCADTPTDNASARMMFDNSEIDGMNDVILGPATVVVNASTIRSQSTGGAILTPSTASTFRGMLVVNSTIDTPSGVTNVALGRPYRQWPDTYTPNSVGQAIIRETSLGAGIGNAPWATGPAGEPWTLGRFGEFNNSGAGAGSGDKRPQLAPADSIDYTVSKWLGSPTWYPPVADPPTPSDVVRPGVPGNVLATQGDGSVSLTWDADGDSDLASYSVYRSTTSPVSVGAATLVKSGLTDTKYTDTGLTNATTYHYVVVAVDSAGNTSGPSADASATPGDTTPPAAPSGLKGFVADGRATLVWSANNEPDLAGYNVYRSTSSPVEITRGNRLNNTPLTSPGYTDSGLDNGTKYTYVVTAQDKSGNESRASSEVDVVPAPGDSTPPSPPSGIHALLRNGAVSVSWSPSTDSDVAGYNVYRSSNGDSPTKVNPNLVTGTSYTDPSAPVGTQSTYTVKALDTSDNESDASAAVSATAMNADVVVAADGSGDATTVQGGINKLADNSDYRPNPKVILVEPGTYNETITSGNRHGVTLVGATDNPANTTITSSGTTPTAALSGNSWTMRNLTLANTAGAATSGAQATALQVKAGDKDVFSNDRFLGDTKTLLLSTANTSTFSRLYFNNDYIEGGGTWFSAARSRCSITRRSTCSTGQAPASRTPR